LKKKEFRLFRIDTPAKLKKNGVGVWIEVSTAEIALDSTAGGVDKCMLKHDGWFILIGKNPDCQQVLCKMLKGKQVIKQPQYRRSHVKLICHGLGSCTRVCAVPSTLFLENVKKKMKMG
jgi:hypothetical protein